MYITFTAVHDRAKQSATGKGFFFFMLRNVCFSQFSQETVAKCVIYASQFSLPGRGIHDWINFVGGHKKHGHFTSYSWFLNNRHANAREFAFGAFRPHWTPNVANCISDNLATLPRTAVLKWTGREKSSPNVRANIYRFTWRQLHTWMPRFSFARLTLPQKVKSLTQYNVRLVIRTNNRRLRWWIEALLLKTTCSCFAFTTLGRHR